MFIITSGKGRATLVLMAPGYLAVRGAFAYLRSSFYYETHVLTINGMGLLLAGLIGFAYACYLYKHPPDGETVKLKDPKTGVFRPVEPISHEISGIPIGMLGTLLMIIGIGMWIWEYLHPKF
jgi:hypothetical protein